MKITSACPCVTTSSLGFKCPLLVPEGIVCSKEFQCIVLHCTVSMRIAPLHRSVSDETKNLTETDTDTFFRYQNFPKPIPIPTKKMEKFRNREVSKLKCQSLTPIKYVNICLKSSKLSMFLKQNSDFLISESTQII